MVEQALLRLIGAGVANLAPALGGQLASEPAIATTDVPGDVLIERLDAESPERMPGFVETAVAKLWQHSRPRDGGEFAERHAIELADQLERVRLDPELVHMAVSSVRDASRRKDSTSQEAKRLAAKALSIAGGGKSLRDQGFEPLYFMSLCENLFSVLLSELPFLDDIAPLIQAALNDEPMLPGPVGELRNDLTINIEELEIDDNAVDGLNRYAAVQLQRLLRRLGDFRANEHADAERIASLIAELAQGRRRNVERGLYEAESALIRAMTTDLALGEIYAPLAAAIRTMRANLCLIIGDFAHADRHLEAAVRHVRVFDFSERWPYLKSRVQLALDCGALTASSEAIVLARSRLDDVEPTLMLTGGVTDAERAEYLLLDAHCAMMEPANPEPNERPYHALVRANEALFLFEVLQRKSDAIAARHIAANAHRQIATRSDDASHYASASELYENVVEHIAAHHDEVAADAIAMAARRADCIRGAWCVLAHAACLSHDGDVLTTPSRAPGGRPARPGPLALCYAPDQRIARARVDATIALNGDTTTAFQSAIRELETIVAELPVDRFFVEIAALEDLIGSLHKRLATNEAADRMRDHLEQALDAKNRAWAPLQAAGHGRADAVAIEIAELEVTLTDIAMDEAGHVTTQGEPPEFEDDSGGEG